MALTKVTSGVLDTLTGLTISAATPSIQMTDSDNNADAFIQATDGNIKFFADDNGEAGSTEITFALDGTQRAKIDADGDLTATNIYAGATGGRTSIVSFPCTTSYPNVSTYSFNLTAAQAPIGSRVIMGIRISSGSSGGEQYAYLTQDQLKGNRIMGYIEGWYWNFGGSALYKIDNVNDRAFTFTHGTITASNSNDYREVFYYGYIMDN